MKPDEREISSEPDADEDLEPFDEDDLSEGEREMLEDLTPEEREVLRRDPFTREAVKRGAEQRASDLEYDLDKYPEVTEKEWNEVLIDHPDLADLEGQPEDHAEEEEEREAAEEPDEDERPEPRSTRRGDGTTTRSGIPARPGSVPEEQTRRLIADGATVRPRVPAPFGSSPEEKKAGPGRFTYSKSPKMQRRKR